MQDGQASRKDVDQNGVAALDEKFVDPELVARAEAAGVDVKAEVEAALRTAIAQESRWRSWRDENRAAIEASNAELERSGPWYTPSWLSP